jgi:hypothetical protein
MSGSTIFTVGTALRRAQDNGLPVTVLVEGHWLEGQVAGLDGDGVVLVSGPSEQAVLRMSSISVVRVQSAMPDAAPSRARPHGPVHEAGPAWRPDAHGLDDLNGLDELRVEQAVIGQQRRQEDAVAAQRRMLALLAD